MNKSRQCAYRICLQAVPFGAADSWTDLMARPEISWALAHSASHLIASSVLHAMDSPLGTVFRLDSCGKWSSKMVRRRKYSLVRGVWSGNRTSLASHISSLITLSAYSFSPSTQSYPTPSENCSFCLQSTSSGRNGSSGTSNALRNTYFSSFGWAPSGLVLRSGIFSLASIVIVRSKKALSRNGTLVSTPKANGALLALMTSNLCNLFTSLTHSLWYSSGLGALWKYKYPPSSSSAPSPDKTTLMPSALIFLASRNIGTAARTCSYDSM
mmetsp:Transcript_14861/g.42370  ORF Transcript_14861/g.42370 Transcript_14861/m.42370 type:complete len:269 (+) Transcript_14861:56-862(+)